MDGMGMQRMWCCSENDKVDNHACNQNPDSLVNKFSRKAEGMNKNLLFEPGVVGGVMAIFGICVFTYTAITAPKKEPEIISINGTAYLLAPRTVARCEYTELIQRTADGKAVQYLQHNQSCKNPVHKEKGV